MSGREQNHARCSPSSADGKQKAQCSDCGHLFVNLIQHWNMSIECGRVGLFAGSTTGHNLVASQDIFHHMTCDDVASQNNAFDEDDKVSSVECIPATFGSSSGGKDDHPALYIDEEQAELRHWSGLEVNDEEDVESSCSLPIGKRNDPCDANGRRSTIRVVFP